MIRQSMRLVPVGPEFDLGPNITDQGQILLWPKTPGNFERVHDPGLYDDLSFGKGLALITIGLCDQGMVVVYVTGNEDRCFIRRISHKTMDEGMARYKHLVRWQSALAFIDHAACALIGLEP
jgi:hypothetical protein